MPGNSDKQVYLAEIMVVDDNPGNLSILESLLSDKGYLVRAVNSSLFALKSIQAHHPDLILLDVKMPEMDGYELCRRLKSDPATKEIPVIFVSMLANPEDQVKGFEVGAVDYISKPIHHQEVLARVRTHVSLYHMQTRLEALVEERTAEIRQSTAELLKTTDLLEAVHEANPDLQFVLDKECRITHYHTRDQSTLYTASENFLGKKMQEVLPDNVGKQFQQAFSAAAASNTLITIEYALSMPDNEHSYEARIVSLKDRRLVVTVRDISERKEAEAENERVQAKLRQAQKMEAIGTMAGGISHDFNNILNIIIGHVDIALYKIGSDNNSQGGNLERTAADDEHGDKIKQNESVTVHLEKVKLAAARAAKLVKQILVFSRQGQPELEPIDPALSIKNSLSLLRSTIPSTVVINQDIDSRCGQISADQTQLHQILMNLCNNAVHAMDEIGEISVVLRPIQLSSNEGGWLDGNKPGAYVRLSVTDSGKGMEQVVIDRLYDPFYTTKGVGEGTGLGMTVVHGLVEGFGGIIHVHSKLGVGSRFDIDLPEIKEQIGPTAKLPHIPANGQERILVIDDEEAIAELLKEQIELYGYDVVSMSNAGEALSIFQADPGIFDLVVTDQTMPNLTGLELAQKMLFLRPDLPIILCTGFSTKATESEIQRIGIKTLLDKPVQIDTLSSTIRTLLDSKG